MRICVIPNCGRKHYSYDLCVMHLRRFEKHGDPLKKVNRDFRTGTLDKSGYMMIKKNGRTQAEHRWIMEEHLGRRLRTDEIVHHINEDKLDNRIENLEIMTLREHIRHHKVGKYRNPNNSKTKKQCPRCKRILPRNKTAYNKASRNHDGLGTCCRECANKKLREYRGK